MDKQVVGRHILWQEFRKNLIKKYLNLTKLMESYPEQLKIYGK